MIQAARAAAQAEGLEGCKITLHFPSYFPVMQYARNRALRETLYTAYVTRASELGPRALDNGPIMRELLALLKLGVAGHLLHVGLVTYGIHWSTAFSSSLILACGPIFTLLILRWMGVERLQRAQMAKAAE